jgi:phosphate transport system permease protein
MNATTARSVNRSEWVINLIVRLSGYSSILFVSLIFLFLLREGLPALGGDIPLSSLFGARWYPIESYFSLLPLLYGSVLVTVGALLIGIPVGVGTSVFIAEVAPPWVNRLVKPVIEILAGLPSVVLGFLGIQVAVPLLRRFFDLPTGLSAFSGAVLLAMIATPTIVSITEDALNTVPRSYREAALAVGATRWQVIWGVTVPAARSGILTAVMLGIGRSIGETMAVMMVTGNAPVLPHGLDLFFTPVRTMTATIASEMGEVANGSQHYQVLFLIGILLFVLSLGINIAASSVSLRAKKRTDKMLS